MTQYKWAANPLKLQRAMSMVNGGDEQAIKAKYKELGGLIIGELEEEATKTENVKESVQETTPEVTESEPEPEIKTEEVAPPEGTGQEPVLEDDITEDTQESIPEETKTEPVAEQPVKRGRKKNA